MDWKPFTSSASTIRISSFWTYRCRDSTASASSRSCLTRKSHFQKIVFATAFDQYAVKAFEVNAVDYLLKPFDKKRVAQSVSESTFQDGSGGLP